MWAILVTELAKLIRNENYYHVKWRLDHRNIWECLFLFPSPTPVMPVGMGGQECLLSFYRSAWLPLSLRNSGDSREFPETKERPVLWSWTGWDVTIDLVIPLFLQAGRASTCCVLTPLISFKVSSSSQIRRSQEPTPTSSLPESCTVVTADRAQWHVTWHHWEWTLNMFSASLWKHLNSRVLENKLLPAFINPKSSYFSQVNLLQRRCTEIVQAYSEIHYVRFWHLTFFYNFPDYESNTCSLQKLKKIQKGT